MQKSLSLMALDIQSNQRNLVSSPEPSPTSPSSAPCSPHHGSNDSSRGSTSVFLKAVADGASRHLAQQHLESCKTTPTPQISNSPASSVLDSPQHSPVQASRLTLNSVLPQPLLSSSAIIAPSAVVGHEGHHLHHHHHHHHHHDAHLHSAVRQLKFSIENILSPAFGKNGKPEGEGRKGSHSRGGGDKDQQKCQRSHPLDVSSLTNNTSSHSNKRKHSSDSESSTLSSLSATSRHDHVNGAKISRSEISPSSAPLTPVSDEPEEKKEKKPLLWPAWVYCTRYSDRPSSVIGAGAAGARKAGPRSRKMKKKEKKADEKRPRTAFTAEQLARLKQEFQENRYLTEKRRQDLARDLKLNESQIKIWFQNKRAKIKKSTGSRNPLALHLMAQGLYNHSTVPVDEEDDEDDIMDDGSSIMSANSDTKNKT